MRLETYLRGAAARLTLSDTPHLDLRLLAKSALALTDSGIILATDRLLTRDEMAHLEALVARRMKGESIAHIIGEKEFYGLTFKLAPGVLSPRPDTETLIDAAARRIDDDAAVRILDLGVGSGVLLCALLTHLPKASGVGVDLNPLAAACARANANRLGLGARARVLCGDWGEALGAAFDVIVSNPPYIPIGDAGELAPEIARFEDPRALFGGADGLGAYRRILPQGRRLLAPKGLMILEFGAGQAETLVQLATTAFAQASVMVEKDLAGRPRALVIET